MWKKLELEIGQPNYYKSQKAVETTKATIAGITDTAMLVARRTGWSDRRGRKLLE